MTEAEQLVSLIETFIVAIVRDEQSEHIQDYIERNNVRASLIDYFGSHGT